MILETCPLCESVSHNLEKPEENERKIVDYLKSYSSVFECKVPLGGFAAMQLQGSPAGICVSFCQLSEQNTSSCLLRRNENKHKELIAIMGAG